MSEETTAQRSYMRGYIIGMQDAIEDIMIASYMSHNQKAPAERSCEKDQGSAPAGDYELMDLIDDLLDVRCRSIQVADKNSK